MVRGLAFVERGQVVDTSIKSMLSCNKRVDTLTLKMSVASKNPNHVNAFQANRQP